MGLPRFALKIQEQKIKKVKEREVQFGKDAAVRLYQPL
jgi:hypothetical protein